MKGKKCLTRFLYLCLALLLSCLLNFGVQKSSSAIEFKDADYFSWIQEGSRIYTNADWYQLYTDGAGGLRRNANLGTTGETLTKLHLCTTSTIPGSSLFSFNISYKSNDFTPLGLTVRDGYVSLLNTNYGEYGTATYTFWTDAPVSGCFDFDVIAKLQGIMDNEVALEISGINSIEFYKGVTYWDIQDVLEAINNGQSDQERTADAVEEQNQKDDQDRADIEEQSGETEQQGQDASDEANQQGQTLLEAFGSLIDAIGNIHSTNCTIPNFSIYGLNFQNMDFCQFNVPSGIMAIASIGMVFIFVPLGINLVKRMISLYNEILGGK